VTGPSPAGVADRHGLLRAVRAAAEAVPDPELPMLTVGDLGIVRDVELDGDEAVVTLTPTYSGCPATEVIRDDVTRAVRTLGVPVRVRTSLTPAWSTDWITPAGRRKLAAAGIAPPAAARDPAGPVLLTIGMRPAAPPCPHCGSAATTELARFGSTPCQSLWRCTACAEPFPHVKAL